jgi:hypothetical protein
MSNNPRAAVRRDSDSGSLEDETMSTISESYGSNFRLPQQSGTDANHIAGYLLKQSKDGVWQKRYFETNGTFLTYYKSKKMTKLLAALNMPNVGEISLVGNVNDSLGEGVIFQLELKDRNYVLRAQSMAEAQRWINGLTVIRNEAKANSIPEDREVSSTTSAAASSQSTRPMEPANIDGKAGSAPQGEFAKSEKKNGCCVVS